MAHEDLARVQHVEGSSNRSFGLVFAVVFTLIGSMPLLHGGAIRLWALGIALAFALVAFLAPRILAVPNRLWTGLGLLLGKVVSPVVIAILFYGVFMPIGLLMRALGKDPLRLRLDRAMPSYWVLRQPPGPRPDSMTDQF